MKDDWLISVGELGGLAEMMAGLIRGNVEANPERRRYLAGRRGTVNIRALDVGEAVALTFGGGGISVASTPHPKPNVEILADAPARVGVPVHGRAHSSSRSASSGASGSRGLRAVRISS